MPRERRTEERLVAHVRRLGEEHPPIDLASVDFTVHDPACLGERFGGVLDYMARVELEVDRNVLELATMLPDPPPVDVFFYRDVWRPQEVRHGQILDELQRRVGRPPAVADTTSVGTKMHVLGAVAHLDAMQDVVRMLYYLTGLATERSAVIAYNRLHDGLLATGEPAAAHTIVAQIRRQEPGHYAFYKLSAEGLAEQLRPWQWFLTRHMRRISFAPVGANDATQRADFGDLLAALGLDGRLAEFAEQISRVEAALLWAHREGLAVPGYVLAAFRDAVEEARARAGAVSPEAPRRRSRSRSRSA